MFVALSGNQTINGTKTFLISPVVPDKTTAAKASGNVIATEYQIRSGDQLLSGRIATLSGKTIVINPVSQNSGQYCYSTDGKTLICNKDLSGSIQQIFEGDTWKLRFKKIIIENFTGTIMTGTNNMLCVKSGDILNCNTDPNSLGDPINIEGEDGQRCTYVCTEFDEKEEKKCLEGHIKCHKSAPSCEGECTGGGDGIQVTHYSGGKVCRYMTASAIETLSRLLGGKNSAIDWDNWTIPEGSGEIRCVFEDQTGGSGGGISIAKDPAPTQDGYCVYVDENTIRCDAEGGSGTSNKIQTINIYSGGNYFTGETINIYSGGDTLWQSTKITVNYTTSSGNLLAPKDTSQDLYLGGDIWHDGALTIKTLGSTTAARENTVTIHQQGVAIGELPNKTAGLGVHGPISVGKFMLTEEEQQQSSASGRPGGQCTNTTYNTISIYASGAGADEHFEILGNPRLLVGVTNGAYMYFVGDGAPNIGINTQNTHATLNIDGSIRIGNCSNNNTCNSASVGEIKYYERNNKGYFVGCRRKSSTGFERVILSDGTETTGANYIGNDCNPPITPYSHDVYGNEGTLMPQQVNCN